MVFHKDFEIANYNLQNDIALCLMFFLSVGVFCVLVQKRKHEGEQGTTLSVDNLIFTRIRICLSHMFDTSVIQVTRSKEYNYRL